jgi:hypothetical protein
MIIQLPIISEATWQLLIKANEDAVRNGWAQPGIFATGVGPEYKPGELGSLLYVGKSAGPLSDNVGSNLDQSESTQASTRWMIQLKNKSAFWQFVDQIDRTRRSIAWTNLCKMDRKGGKTPPSPRQWAQVHMPCIAALEEEIVALKPKVTVFATSGLYGDDVWKLLTRLSYQYIPSPLNDKWTRFAQSSGGQFVILTKHPQGWLNSERGRVIERLRALLRGSA